MTDVSTQEPEGTQAPAAAAPAGQAAPAPSFLDSLPPEFRGDPSFAKYKDVGDMAKSLKYAERFTGNQDPNRVVLLPTDMNDEKAAAELFKRLGRPDTADGYKLDDVKAPEGMPIDPNFQKEMIGVLHAAGATEAQVKKILGGYYEKTAGMFAQAGEAAKQMAADSETNLRKEWGAKFDENFAVAETVLDRHFGEHVDKIKELGLHNQDWFIKSLASLGAASKEGEFRYGEGGGSNSGAKTPAEATAEIAKLRADENFAKQLSDRDNPGHKVAVDQLEKLYQIAHPSQKRA